MRNAKAVEHGKRGMHRFMSVLKLLGDFLIHLFLPPLTLSHAQQHPPTETLL